MSVIWHQYEPGELEAKVERCYAANPGLREAVERLRADDSLDSCCKRDELAEEFGWGLAQGLTDHLWLLGEAL